MDYMISRIKTKADAMAFAIEKCGDDLGKADKIYRMFVDNMELPDTEQEPGNNFYVQAAEAMKTLSETFKSSKIQNIDTETVKEEETTTEVEAIE